MTVSTGLIAPILEDLQLGADAAAVVELPPDAAGAARALAAAAGPQPLVAVLPGHPDAPALARLRDAVWPALHFVSVYRVAADGGIRRLTLQESAPLAGRASGAASTVIVARRRLDALDQRNTRAKFDARASAWNGEPGSPGYGHYRWMRKLITDVARPRRGQRVLDAGCGAGWVGLEAARAGAEVSAFDPSPAMIEIARRNAAELGVSLDARVGFVEDVPFERRFEIVLNSGVISFAPDPAAYIEGLDALVEPGGLLVIGDLNPLSRGFLRRRRRQPLLPSRELNSLPRARVEVLLAGRGYAIESRRYYQLTSPVPQLMALCEARGRALACRLLLGMNRAATALDALAGSRSGRLFDSWILRARKAR